jgi:hypothetical protein
VNGEEIKGMRATNGLLLAKEPERSQTIVAAMDALMVEMGFGMAPRIQLANKWLSGEKYAAAYEFVHAAMDKEETKKVSKETLAQKRPMAVILFRIMEEFADQQQAEVREALNTVGGMKQLARILMDADAWESNKADLVGELLKAGWGYDKIARLAGQLKVKFTQKRFQMENARNYKMTKAYHGAL